MSGVIAKYHCNYCQEDITGVRVKCAECPDFDLCLQCFSCGAEMGAHKNRHGYQLIDCGNFPIFGAPCNWKAKEELVLLEAIEQYGFGNWEDVSQCLPSRSSEEVQEHYNNHYIVGNIGRATWSTEVSTEIKDHTVPEGGPLSPSLSSAVAPVDITPSEQQELGYMPCRDDYEREYDNEAESLISQLSVGGPEEDELETALKLAQVDMYSRRLRERMRRKGLVRDYRLLEQFCHAGRPKASPVGARSKRNLREADRELQEKMRIFCQFQSAAEHEQLLENLEREKELKARIKELLRYRRNGITKLDECSEFDVARHRREKRKEVKKKSAPANSVHKKPISTASKKYEEKGGVDIILNEQEGDTREDSKEATDITSLPGYELLSDKEKKLCQSMGISPACYITFKTVVLKDQAQRQKGSIAKFRSPAGLDKSHCRRILNHFANSGWISAN
ncbi:transcriptional adapter 2B isoform X7 [Amblyomma americanum]